MSNQLHPRAFKVTVGWTLILLFLGSVVHATGSSLACPDWPTCYGTMVPNMSGGVFWEHLHRLVAGGLVLMFCLATYLAHKEVQGERRWIVKACWGGIALLLVQSAFGGLTVIFRLPAWISTTHLALAFSFLSLATFLAAATSRAGATPRGRVAKWAAVGAGLVFVQSVLGALVRHLQAGMACPDAPLCLGQVVPPLVNAPITVHFTHRVLALLVGIYVLAFAYRVLRAETDTVVRRLAGLAAALVVTQIGLGFASVLTVLAVVPVSLHTLVAASLLATLVALATLTSLAAPTVPSHSGSPVDSTAVAA